MEGKKQKMIEVECLESYSGYHEVIGFKTDTCCRCGAILTPTQIDTNKDE